MIKYQIQKSDLEFFERFHKRYPKTNLDIAKELFSIMLENANEDDIPSLLFSNAVLYSQKIENLGKIDLLNIGAIFITDNDFPVEKRFREHFELKRLGLGKRTKENLDFLIDLSTRFQNMKIEPLKSMIKHMMQDDYTETLTDIYYDKEDFKILKEFIYSVENMEDLYDLIVLYNNFIDSIDGLRERMNLYRPISTKKSKKKTKY